MSAASAVTVRVRAPAAASAVRVAVVPSENVRTVPLPIPASRASTATVVAEVAASAAQVTICLPVYRAIIGLVDFLGAGQASFAQAEFAGREAEVYLFAAAVYGSISFTFSRYSRRLEARLGVGVR